MSRTADRALHGARPRNGLLIYSFNPQPKVLKLALFSAEGTEFDSLGCKSQVVEAFNRYSGLRLKKRGLQTPNARFVPLILAYGCGLNE